MVSAKDIVNNDNIRIQLQELLNSNLSKVSIARELGCTPKTLNKALKDMGINYNFYIAVSGNNGKSKICKVCKKTKPLSEYYISGSGRQLNTCKPCVRAEEKLKYNSKIKSFNDYKSSIGCQKCRDTRHYVLDFHHKDPNEKEFTLANKARASFFNEEVQNEIKKCVLLCSNCHREFHYLERTLGMTITEYLPSK